MKRAAVSVVVLLAALLMPAQALAQEMGEVEIAGRVEHGAGAASFDPTQARVTLNVLEGITLVSQDSALPMSPVHSTSWLLLQKDVPISSPWSTRARTTPPCAVRAS